MAPSMNIYFLVCAWLINLVFAWKASEFPNPNKDVNLCGRGSVKSWVCDPDNVLKKKEADTLEEWLMLINQETQSGCVGASKGQLGYEIGVALVKNMDIVQGQTKAETAERFAKSLHDNWGVGKQSCNDGALIFLSLNDHQIYISTGKRTKKKLTNKQINLIIEKMRPLLREKQYSSALEKCLMSVKDILQGKPLEKPYFSLGAVVFFIIFGLAVVGMINSYYNGKKFNEFQRKLGRIDQERRDPKEYTVLVCPICLEDFTPHTEVKLLVCGHKYCKPCLSQWLKNKTFCPICRENVNRKPRDNWDTEGELHDSLMEQRYRLSSLHHQYPDFVSQDTISHWLSPNFHGSFLDDVNDRRTIPRSYDGSHGNSSDFGGGSSTGGGGSGGNW